MTRQGGQSVVELMVSLTTMLSFVSAILLLIYYALSFFLIRTELESTLICLHNGQSVYHCQSRATERLDDLLPFGQVTKLLIERHHARLVGYVRFELLNLVPIEEVQELSLPILTFPQSDT